MQKKGSNFPTVILSPRGASAAAGISRTKATTREKEKLIEIHFPAVHYSLIALPGVQRITKVSSAPSASRTLISQRADFSVAWVENAIISRASRETSYRNV